MNILVVEDEQTDFILIEYAVRQLNDAYRIVHAQGCAEALETIAKAPVNLAVVDLLLPDGDGRKLAEHLTTHRIPYVMVTSRSHPDHAVQCLKAGAEDYIRKPFDIEELSVRIERVLLRTEKRAHTAMAALFMEKEGGIQLRDTRVPLTPIEQKLIHLLHRRYDTYVSSDELIKTAWGQTNLENAKGALRTYISHIRKKLLNTETSFTIVSKWGHGYRLTEVREPQA